MSDDTQQSEYEEGKRTAQLRLLEAVLFASDKPLGKDVLKECLEDKTADVDSLLEALTAQYASSGVNLVCMGDRWMFRTSPDLAARLQRTVEQAKKLPRVAVETLAIIAYHQPVTRAEIESIRGVITGKGTLDTLMEAGLIKPGPRRETPGRPLTWLTTEQFLDTFGLASLADLPGVDDLKAAGLLDARPVLATSDGEENSANEESAEDSETEF